MPTDAFVLGEGDDAMVDRQTLSRVRLLHVAVPKSAVALMQPSLGPMYTLS